MVEHRLEIVTASQFSLARNKRVVSSSA